MDVHGPLSCRPENQRSPTGGNFWPAEGRCFWFIPLQWLKSQLQAGSKADYGHLLLGHTRKAGQDQTEDWQAVRKGRWAQGMRRLLLTPRDCGLGGWLVATSPGEEAPGGGTGTGNEGASPQTHTVFEGRLLYQGSPPRVMPHIPCVII